VSFWRDQGIFYFGLAFSDGLAIAVLALGSRNRRRRFNSEDLCAAHRRGRAGVATAKIENGRLPQLHLRADESRPDARVSTNNILEVRSTMA